MLSDLNAVLGGNAASGQASLSCWVRDYGQGWDPQNWRAPAITGVEQNGTVNDIYWGTVNQAGQIGVVPGDLPGVAQSAGWLYGTGWRHLVFTRRNTGELEAYVDGVLQAPGVVTADTGALTTSFLSIGRAENVVGTAGMPVFWMGDLDEVRVYDTILTPAQIQTLGNRPPVVNAGPDQGIPGNTVTLNGSVTDDGLPNPPGAVTFSWSQVSGPGVATFSSTTVLNPTVTFSTIGTYVLRLTASDGQLTSSDDIRICVGSAVLVSPTSLTTYEDQTQPPATFTVVLSAAPAAGTTVTVPLMTSNAAEGLISTTPPPTTWVASGTLTFTSANWNVPQTVWVKGQDDAVLDFNVAYSIVVAPASSNDPCYNGFDPPDVSVVNIDNEVPPPVRQVWGGCFSAIGLNPSGTFVGLAALAALVVFLPRRRRAAGLTWRS